MYHTHLGSAASILAYYSSPKNERIFQEFIPYCCFTVHKETLSVRARHHGSAMTHIWGMGRLWMISHCGLQLRNMVTFSATLSSAQELTLSRN